jgi:hypothetical protein
MDEIRKIEEEIRLLEMKIDSLGKLFKNTEAKNAANKKAEWLKADAEAKIKIYEEEKKTNNRTTDAIRAAKAVVQCDLQFREMQTAVNDFTASKEVLRSLQTQLSGKQSRLGLYKSEFWVAGMAGDLHNQPRDDGWETNEMQLNEDRQEVNF